jgi:maltose alpha-D-glucosyltransferase/alpha-amylase
MNGANKLGIKVIIDLVVNHTSDQRQWLQTARKDKKSKYRDWYLKKNYWGEEYLDEIDSIDHDKRNASFDFLVRRIGSNGSGNQNHRNSGYGAGRQTINFGR